MDDAQMHIEFLKSMFYNNLILLLRGRDRMAKWADYLVSAVRYDGNKERIEQVKVHEDKGDSVGTVKVWTRAQVVSAIGQGMTCCTILQSGDQWRRGEDIHVVVVGGEKFIRTDANSVKRDNLGELPEF